MANVEGASRLGPGVRYPSQSSAEPHATFSAPAEAAPAHDALVGEITEFETRVRALLAQHAAVLLQEPLLTVWSAAGISSDGHHMLPAVVALDKQGRQVVVTVAYRLTPQGILDAIMCAGRFGYLTRTQIAEHYPGGSLEFEFAAANFYGEDRETASRVAMPSVNARLVIVCGDVDEESHGAMRFLHGSGGIVEVLPLTAQVVNRVVQQVRNRTSGAQSSSSSTMAKPVSVARQQVPEVASGEAPAQKESVSTPLSSATVRADGTAVTESSEQAPVPMADTLAVPKVSSPSPQMAPTPAAAPTSGQVPAPTSSVANTSQLTSSSLAQNQVDGVSKPGLSPQRRAEPLTITTEIPIVDPAKKALPRTVLPRPINRDNRPPARRLAVRTVALEAAVSGRSAESIVSGIEGTQQQRDLTSLCAELESAVPLVWQPPSSDRPFTATLDPNGTITTDSGLTFTSPTRAAKAVSGTLSSNIDGWNVWRIGERGPTLAEAWREIFG